MIKNVTNYDFFMIGIWSRESS